MKLQAGDGDVGIVTTQAMDKAGLSMISMFTWTVYSKKNKKLSPVLRGIQPL